MAYIDLSKLDNPNWKEKEYLHILNILAFDVKDGIEENNLEFTLQNIQFVIDYFFSQDNTLYNYASDLKEKTVLYFKDKTDLRKQLLKIAYDKIYKYLINSFDNEFPDNWSLKI